LEPLLTTAAGFFVRVGSGLLNRFVIRTAIITITALLAAAAAASSSSWRFI